MADLFNSAVLFNPTAWLTSLVWGISCIYLLLLEERLNLLFV